MTEELLEPEAVEEEQEEEGYGEQVLFQIRSDSIGEKTGRSPEENGDNKKTYVAKAKYFDWNGLLILEADEVDCAIECAIILCGNPEKLPWA